MHWLWFTGNFHRFDFVSFSQEKLFSCLLVISLSGQNTHCHMQILIHSQLAYTHITHQSGSYQCLITAAHRTSTRSYRSEVYFNLMLELKSQPSLPCISFVIKSKLFTDCTFCISCTVYAICHQSHIESFLLLQFCVACSIL